MTEPCDPTGHPWQTYCSVHDSWRIVGADCWVARAEKAEATIQRVRDVCDLWQRRHDSSIRHPADIPAVAIVAVLRALDGDGDA